MGLREELGLPNRLEDEAHEVVMAVVLTAMLMAKEGDRFLKPKGLTSAQINVLLLLKYQSDRGEINQSRLGTMLLVNRANVTGLIDRLEKLGWVARGADPGDRRVKLVRLTESGAAVLRGTEKAYFHRVAKITAGLGKEGRARLLALLEVIRGGLKTGGSR